MRTISFSFFLLLLASCSPDSGGVCTSASECALGEVCVDSVCRAGSDGGAADVGVDTGPVDVGPGVDAGPQTDAGPPDAICGGGEIPFEYNPPNVLLILDRSCSMRRPLDAGPFGTGPDDPTTRWNIARTAVLDLLDNFGARAFWGLMAFPDPGMGCGDSVSAEVPPGPGNIPAIEAALRSELIQPFGLCGLNNDDPSRQPRHTPTGDALLSARSIPEFSDAARASFAIIVTDGGATCDITPAELTALSVGLRDAGIPVGVIGFNTGTDVPTLTAIAEMGGLANPAGAPYYYTAEDAASLTSVLDEIAERVVSCDFPLGSVPPDPSMLFVNVNDMMQTMDPVDGWSYQADTNTLTFNGALCDRLRRGDITRLGVSFGCPPMECVPRPEVCNSLDEDCDDRVDEDCLL